MEFSEEYLGLALRYLRGEANDSDKDILIHWLEEDPRRKEDFAALSALCKTSYILKSEDERTSRMLSRLNARIDSEEETTTHKRKAGIFRILWMSAASAAAIFIIGIGVHRFGGADAKDCEYTAYSNTSDDVAAIMLDDSTKVWLGTKSSILFNTDARNTERIVKLTGEAYFDVHRDTSRPFIVKTGSIDVRVLGTAFCVEADEISGKVSVLLERGSVRLQSPEGVSLVRLFPDQKAEFDTGTGDISVEPMGAVPYIVQHYNKVALQQVSLRDIISHIERMYGVRITTHAPVDTTRKYNLNYKRTDNVSELVETVQELTGANLTISGQDNTNID